MARKSMKDNTNTTTKPMPQAQVQPNGAMPSLDETIEILTNQIKEYEEKRVYFNNMSLKAQGALEVINQLNRKESEGEA